jgi:bacteriorhodopsin
MTTAPWEATLTTPEHSLISFFLLFAAILLAVGVVRSVMTRDEIGVRYRTATIARTSLKLAATIAYVVIAVNFQTGYDHTAVGWVPNEGAIETFAPRYVEWAISVPLLVIELLAVTPLVGAALRRTRAVTAIGAFLMIFTGYIGAIVAGGDDRAQMLIWGGISAVFWILVTAILVRTVRISSTKLTVVSGSILRDAATVLLSGWVVYPIVFALQIFASGGVVTTIVQVSLCVADVAIKLGFGGLTHRVAKLRTAEDVRNGEDVHPEAIWISSEKQSDAGTARPVYIDEDLLVHQRRERPADSAAIAAPFEPQGSDFD